VLEVAYGDIPVNSVFTRWPSYLSSCLCSSGWAVAGLELRAIVSHITRENSRCVSHVQLLVDNFKIYEAHNFELETAQFSPRQPYVIEEQLPADVEAECQSEL